MTKYKTNVFVAHSKTNITRLYKSTLIFHFVAISFGLVDGVDTVYVVGACNVEEVFLSCVSAWDEEVDNSVDGFFDQGGSLVLV